MRAKSEVVLNFPETSLLFFESSRKINLKNITLSLWVSNQATDYDSTYDYILAVSNKGYTPHYLTQIIVNNTREVYLTGPAEIVWREFKILNRLVAEAGYIDSDYCSADYDEDPPLLAAYPTWFTGSRKRLTVEYSLECMSWSLFRETICFYNDQEIEDHEYDWLLLL